MLAGLLQTGSVSGHPGILKAAGSNQPLMLRCPEERLPFPMRSGNPPKLAVLEGSKPSKEGVNHKPDCAVTVQVERHPPRTCWTGPWAFDRKCWPCPKGSV